MQASLDVHFGSNMDPADFDPSKPKGGQSRKGDITQSRNGDITW